MQYDYLEGLVKDLSLYKIKTEINMKNLRIWQTLSLWLVLLVTSLPLSAQTALLEKLGKIADITGTQPLESTEFHTAVRSSPSGEGFFQSACYCFSCRI